VGRLIDAVTIDAYGTLVELEDPVPRLRAALARRGVDRARDEVAAAFAAELEYYAAHRLEGRGEAGLARLRADCAGVFLRAAGVELDGAEFSEEFQTALVFEPLPGTREALERLRSLGLALGVVSNWDSGLEEQLERIGLRGQLDVVVTAAEAGVEKPDPEIFRIALERLETSAERALHVGDAAADKEGARRAGMAYAPPPLAALPDRLA
jgi:putative hydrolase of the HAD superfamily